MSIVSPALTFPDTKVPDTTVPTPGTENTSSTVNSARSLIFPVGILGWRRLKKVFRLSSPSPVTDDTRNIGATRSEQKFCAAITKKP